jgi:hypothetical protein
MNIYYILQKTRMLQEEDSIRKEISHESIVAYLLHARTFEPQKQPFISNTRM